MASSQLRALVLGLALNCSVGLHILPQNVSLTEAPANKTQMAEEPVNETDTDEEPPTMEEVSQERAYIKHIFSGLQALVQSDESFAKSELASDVKSFVNTLEVGLNETASITDPGAAMEKLDAFGDNAIHLLDKVTAKQKDQQKNGSTSEGIVLAKIAGLLSGPTNNTQMAETPVNETDTGEEPPTMEEVSLARTSVTRISSGLVALLQSDESFAKSELASDVKSFVKTLELGLEETSSITDPAAALERLDALGDGATRLLDKVTAEQKEVPQKAGAHPRSLALAQIAGLLSSEALPNQTQMHEAPVDGSDTDEDPPTMEEVSQSRASIKQISSELSALVQSDESFAKSELASDVKDFVNTLEVGLNETASITDPGAAMEKLDALGGDAAHLLDKVTAKQKEVQQKRGPNAEGVVLKKILGVLSIAPSQ